MQHRGNADDEDGSHVDTPLVSGLVLTVGRSFRAQAGKRLAELGLYPGQDLVILLLGDDALSQRELADRMRVEPPTMTRMVQRLELAGIVERSTDTRDARVSRVRLSSRGQALRKPVAKIRADLDASSINGLNNDELEQLRALLNKVLVNLAHHNERFSCTTAQLSSESSESKETSWPPPLKSAVSCPGPPSPPARRSRS